MPLVTSSCLRAHRALHAQLLHARIEFGPGQISTINYRGRYAPAVGYIHERVGVEHQQVRSLADGDGDGAVFGDSTPRLNLPGKLPRAKVGRTDQKHSTSPCAEEMGRFVSAPASKSEAAL